MYNHLVQHCFEKCVMTGWDGVSLLAMPIYLKYILMGCLYDVYKLILCIVQCIQHDNDTKQLYNMTMIQSNNTT